MTAQVSCPGCGAPILFRLQTSAVVVCEFCQQVVARTDVGVEDLGKSNPILVLPSAFKLGATGDFAGRPFRIVGRTQLNHQLGGTWNEWYAAFENGKWGWIAEHQGRIAVLGEVSAAQAPDIHSIEAAEPGSRWFSGRGPYVVNERGVATVVAEEGELPWRAVPNEQRAYVDLASPGGGFATLDFGPMHDGAPQGPKRFFVGHEATVASLKLLWPDGEKPPTTIEGQIEAMQGQGGFGGAAPKVEAKKLSCPNCGAPLSPKQDTQSLTCSSCASVLDVNEHRDLKLLQKQTLSFSPQIPVGTRGRFTGEVTQRFPASEREPFDVEVVAHLVRSLVEDGETYYYYEHLLQSPTRGYLWLVLNEEGWWLYKPINVGDVTRQGMGVAYKGARFNRKETFQARVAQVQGELYWKVRVGDTSSASDYVGPGARLSSEKTKDEENWTWGFAVGRNLLSKVFGRPIPGMPGGSSSGSYSSSSSSNQQLTPGSVIFLLVIIMLFFMMTAMCGGGSSGGGGHSSYSSGGSYSFGK